MPRIKLTKSTIDVLPRRPKDTVYWDTGLPGFGVKVTPKGRKVFIVLYRTGGAGTRLRKFTIGPYGRVTLHQIQLYSGIRRSHALANREKSSTCSISGRTKVISSVILGSSRWSSLLVRERFSACRWSKRTG